MPRSVDNASVAFKDRSDQQRVPIPLTQRGPIEGSRRDPQHRELIEQSFIRCRRTANQRWEMPAAAGHLDALLVADDPRANRRRFRRSRCRLAGKTDHRHLGHPRRTNSQHEIGDHTQRDQHGHAGEAPPSGRPTQIGGAGGLLVGCAAELRTQVPQERELVLAHDVASINFESRARPRWTRTRAATTLQLRREAISRYSRSSTTRRWTASRSPLGI